MAESPQKRERMRRKMQAKRDKANRRVERLADDPMAPDSEPLTPQELMGLMDPSSED